MITEVGGIDNDEKIDAAFFDTKLGMSYTELPTKDQVLNNRDVFEVHSPKFDTVWAYLMPSKETPKPLLQTEVVFSP